MGNFNRGSNGAGRRRDLARMPDESAGEGTTGNVIPRGTTKASVRRGQALLRMMNDRLEGAGEFNRGTRAGARRRNFSLMATVASAAAAFSVQVVAGPETRPLENINWTVEFTSANYDPDGMWLPPEKIVCQSDGTYTCEYEVIIEPWDADLGVGVKKNGVYAGIDFFSAGETSLTGSFSVPLIVGDEVTLNIENPNTPSVDLEIVSVLFTVTKT